VRGFSDADLIQSNGGAAALVSSQTLTVPSGSAEGNSGIIVVGVQVPVTTPDQWHIAASPSGGLLQVLCRADLPAGESSWTLDGLTAGGWAWTVAEWANIAFAPIESAVAAAGAGGVSSLSTGSTGTFATEWVMGIAAFCLQTSGGAVWPSVSYDNGFTETDSQQSGDGTNAGDVLLKVARRYGTDSETGPWSCTATFTGSMASKTPHAALVVFRAEDTADPPLPPMTN
jgi:hypothetical protein